MTTDWILSWVGSFSYPAVYLLLLACGMGAPLSEDVIVLVGGTVAARIHANLPLMMLTAYLGKLSGDALLFRVGRRLGPHALSQPRFKGLFTPGRVAWIEGHFARYGLLTVFLARFLPGLRAPTYLVAGASGFPPRRFLLADGAAAAISAPLLTWLGYRFGLGVLGALHQAMHGLLWAVLGGVALLAVVGGVRRRRAARLAAAAVPGAVVEELPLHVKVEV